MQGDVIIEKEKVLPFNFSGASISSRWDTKIYVEMESFEVWK
jgi:hypothetical protein